MELSNGLYVPPEIRREICNYIIDKRLAFKYVMHEIKYLNWYMCYNTRYFPDEYFKIASVIDKTKRRNHMKTHYIHSMHERQGLNCSWTHNEICFAYPNPKYWIVNRPKILYYCKVFYNTLLHPDIHVTDQPIYMYQFVRAVKIWLALKNKLMFINVSNITKLNYILGGYGAVAGTNRRKEDEINEKIVCGLLLTIINKSIIHKELTFKHIII
tara:strand:+ start:1595 stop:2233 length:639 start_codon:yes stop_codon:yes gene_type:complete